MNTPKPTGKYAVGTFTYTVKDDRPEALDPQTMRSVAARVYYPVNKSDTEGCTKARYLSKEMTEGIRKMFKLPLKYEKLEAAGENVSECYENAPRPEGVKFPLILFSHGLGSYREGNSFLCIELASHGYVVISVGHARDAILTEFDDGSSVPFDKRVTKNMYQPYLGAAFAMLKLLMMKGSEAEIAQKFDEFQDKYSAFSKGRLDEWVKDSRTALKYAKENLSELIDFEKGVGASGHSFGGDTAYALCAGDPEFVCGVNIDGALFGDYKEAVQEKPFMQVSCKSNEKVVSRVYLRHTKPVWKVLFRDMKHVGFSDMKFRIRIASMAGKLPADVMHENLCHCHLEFFDTYLKGLKAEPELKSNDAVTVTKYEEDLS